jgi:hypothetical protein
MFKKGVNNMAEKGIKPKQKRLSKGARKHIRREKQAARQNNLNIV